MNRILKKILVFIGFVAPYIVIWKLYSDKKKLEKKHTEELVEAYFEGREDERAYLILG